MHQTSVSLEDVSPCKPLSSRGETGMFIRACRNLTLESAHRDRADRQTDRQDKPRWTHRPHLWALEPPQPWEHPRALLSLSLPMNKPTHGPGTGALHAPMADPLKEEAFRAFRAMLHRICSHLEQDKKLLSQITAEGNSSSTLGLHGWRNSLEPTTFPFVGRGSKQYWKIRAAGLCSHLKRK